METEKIVVNVPRKVKDKAKNMGLYLTLNAGTGILRQIVSTNVCLNQLSYMWNLREKRGERRRGFL